MGSAVILAGDGTLSAEHFKVLPRPVERISGDSGLDVSVGATIDEAEQTLIRATLAHTGNNKTRAANILGISARTLHAKLKQYKLESEELAAAE
jgi:DNA-binding NtrC family response regulator